MWEPPASRAIAEVGEDSMLIAYEMIDARRLDHMAGTDVSERVLRELWQHVERLREHHIAHRDLRSANVLVDGNDEPWLTGFAFGEIAASDEQLDGDIAQLLAALSLTVGAERAVTAAVATLGPQTVGTALPRLQPNALSDSTRAALKERPGLLEELQDTVSAQCGVSEPTYVPLERISKQRIFTAVMLVAATYVLLPQLADLPGVVREIAAAQWGWVPLVLLFSALTYVAAALGMGGSVPTRLRAVPTLLTQLAASFASNLAPAGIGGMALNVRFLRKSGVDAPVAASSVGLNAAAGLAVHVGLMVVFFAWAGGSAFGSISVPGSTLVIAGVAVAAVCVGAVAIPVAAFRDRDARRAGAAALVERPRGRDPQPRQDHAAPRRLGRAHVELRARGVLLGGCLRRAPQSRPGRRRVPGRLGHRHGGAHAGRPRRVGGGGDRRPRRRRHAEHRSGPGRVPVPARHLLAADPPGLARVQPPPPRRLRVARMPGLRSSGLTVLMAIRGGTRRVPPSDGKSVRESALFSTLMTKSAVGASAAAGVTAG